MNRAAHPLSRAWALSPVFPLALSACAAPQSYTAWSASAPEAYEVGEIKRDAARFLARHGGKRVLVEGYFYVSLFVEAFAPDGVQHLCSGDRARFPRFVHIDLPLGKALFERAVQHWVVVEATVSPPRELTLGGGDLALSMSEDDLYLILDDARLVAVDDERRCLAFSEVPDA